MENFRFTTKTRRTKKEESFFSSCSLCFCGKKVSSNVGEDVQLRIATFLVCIAVCWGIGVRAGDWPQILGPHRNGAAEKESLAAQWPDDGPPLRWQRDVGSGYAGIAVAKG